MLTAVLILLPAVLGLLIAGFVWQNLSQRTDKLRYPAPGTLVENEGAARHLHCAGQGQPPVILEAGIAGSSVGWARVLPELAKLTSVCAHDRPGLGWSSPSIHPRTPGQFMRELQAIVEHAGLPVVLVGHSFGALLVRLYAAHHPDEVLGIVLVDPPLLLDWANPSLARVRMLARGVSLSKRGAFLAQIGFVRLALRLLSKGSRNLPKLFARVSSGGGASVTERLVGEVRKLPPELWPVVQSQWCRPSSFRSMAAHLASLPDLAAEVARNPLHPDTPVIVISPDDVSEHREIATKHIIAEGSGHWVHLDRPDLIIEAVKTLIKDRA